MPRRRRTRGRRPRSAPQREGEAPPPAEARPAVSVVAPEETAEHPDRVPRRASPVTGTAATKTASRHIQRDYSYVPGELKRIAITVGAIIAGLIAAAIALR